MMLGWFRHQPLCVDPVFTSGCVSERTALRSGDSSLILGGRRRIMSAALPAQGSVFLLVGNLFIGLLMSLEMKDSLFRES